VLFSATLIVAVLTAVRSAYAFETIYDPPSSVQAGQPLDVSVFVYDDDATTLVRSRTYYDMAAHYSVSSADGGVTDKSVQAPRLYGDYGDISLTIPGSDIEGTSFSYYLTVSEVRHGCFGVVVHCGTFGGSKNLGPYTVPVTN
jgi:hypothetical protein